MKILSLSFSWKCALGISKVKQDFVKVIGIHAHDWGDLR